MSCFTRLQITCESLSFGTIVLEEHPEHPHEQAEDEV